MYLYSAHRAVMRGHLCDNTAFLFILIFDIINSKTQQVSNNMARLWLF